MLKYQQTGGAVPMISLIPNKDIEIKYVALYSKVNQEHSYMPIYTVNQLKSVLGGKLPPKSSSQFGSPCCSCTDVTGFIVKDLSYGESKHWF